MDNLEASARALLSEWEDVRVEQRGALWRISGLFRGAGYSAARENDPVSLARDMDQQARRTPAPILPPEVIEVERIVEVESAPPAAEQRRELAQAELTANYSEERIETLRLAEARYNHLLMLQATGNEVVITDEDRSQHEQWWEYLTLRRIADS